VVDFGRTVQMASPFYSLNAPKDAVSHRFDLNCLAVTIKESGMLDLFSLGMN
jgi:hypothetical protein